MTEAPFPLPAKVRRAGGFDGKSLLIAAPTATGKSKVGIDLLFHYLRSKPAGAVNTYLVPYRALAREVFASTLERGRMEASTAVIKIATGDYADPELDLGRTDILIATYEKCDSLLRDEPDFRPYVIVADEIHHLGDESRGARIEGLLTRLTAGRGTPLLFPLSATVGNAEELARWLQIQPLIGTEKDRVVTLSFERRFSNKPGEVLQMLGRAGRPGLDTEGRGLVLFDVQDEARPEAEALWQAIEAKRSPDPPDAEERSCPFQVGSHRRRRADITRNRLRI